ncbi:MAG: DUF1573 domain-containing protein [Bacteroidetes bacterium]|nr:DUF1573 domain-containing protein [Bacteroidota bacterium]
MKHLILALAITFSGLALNAQNNEESAPVNPNAPVIEFENTVHDYGTIYQGGDGTCSFKFTNNGKEPLILSRPKSSCGCTVPTWPKQPILPGKSDEIKVTYATSRVGPINKTVTIYSNASNNPIVLRIKGKVVAQPAEIMPEKETEDGATPVNK